MQSTERTAVDAKSYEYFANSPRGKKWLSEPLNRAIAVGYPKQCSYSYRSWNFRSKQSAIRRSLTKCLEFIKSLEAHTFANCGCRVVALNSDTSVRTAKGPGRPVNPLAERMEVLAALSAVDFVTTFDGATCDTVLEVVRPDVHAKGPDYTPDNLPERETLRRLGIRLVTVGDPKDHSSSALASELSRTGGERT